MGNLLTPNDVDYINSQDLSLPQNRILEVIQAFSDDTLHLVSITHRGFIGDHTYVLCFHISPQIRTTNFKIYNPKRYEYNHTKSEISFPDTYLLVSLTNRPNSPYIQVDYSHVRYLIYPLDKGRPFTIPLLGSFLGNQLTNSYICTNFYYAETSCHQTSFLDGVYAALNDYANSSYNFDYFLNLLQSPIFVYILKQVGDQCSFKSDLFKTLQQKASTKSPSLLINYIKSLCDSIARYEITMDISSSQTRYDALLLHSKVLKNSNFWNPSESINSYSQGIYKRAKRMSLCTTTNDKDLVIPDNIETLHKPIIDSYHE